MWPFSTIKNLHKELAAEKQQRIDVSLQYDLITAELKKLKAPSELKDNLVFCFKDLEGKSYYKWHDQITLPVQRMAEMVRFTMELSAGINDHELDRLLDMSDAASLVATKNPKELARIPAINHEIRLRKKQIVNINLYYNLFAVNYIREDENPLVYNLQAQKEKVKAFKAGAEIIDSFFFALPELKALCSQLNILTDNWKEIENLSLKAEERNQQAETILKS